jgi:hypothetical protein
VAVFLPARVARDGLSQETGGTTRLCCQGDKGRAGFRIPAVPGATCGEKATSPNRSATSATQEWPPRCWQRLLRRSMCDLVSSRVEVENHALPL